MSGERGPAIEGGDRRQFPKNESLDQLVMLRNGPRTPPVEEPFHEFFLSGDIFVGPFDRLSVLRGGFMLKPFIPQPCDVAQRRLGANAGPKSFVAPVPEGPEPNKSHR